MGDKITVLLVDDHAIARNGVRLMLGTATDISVEGEAGNAVEAMARVAERSFDVALVDIKMPGKNGLDLLKSLRSECPRMAVLVLSTYSEEIYAVRALKLGASGYLTKDAPTPTLIEAVRKAAAGGKHVSPALLEKLATLVGGGPSGDHEELSNRELEVFKLIAQGEPLVQIGEKLHLSPNTVTTYRSRILEKMGMSSNAELTRYALEHGLI
ncbi:response regulator [Pseudoduganella sp. DS3]|uniref:Response regulator n=1 Tax=Pseudoduganella guangdongensis TaxID=2692179 RepID=A0A6N9HJE7_9BURK|nr:response regulator transcription factor [Pseudoduganella guangdongensis]MYN03708.1 response regulator [Pseudoduganella guangdongensis]